jgi:hypothetical protein
VAAIHGCVLVGGLTLVVVIVVVVLLLRGVACLLGDLAVPRGLPHRLGGPGVRERLLRRVLDGGGGVASPRVVGRLPARLVRAGSRLVVAVAVAVVGALRLGVAVALQCLQRPAVVGRLRGDGAGGRWRWQDPARRRGVAVVVVLVQAEAGEPEAHSSPGDRGRRRRLAISCFV